MIFSVAVVRDRRRAGSDLKRPHGLNDRQVASALSRTGWNSSSLAPILCNSVHTLPRRGFMSSPVSQLATRIAYGARQLPRVAWYVGHSMVMRRLSESVREREGPSTRPRAHTEGPVPDRRRLYADMATLFRQDLA